MTQYFNWSEQMAKRKSLRSDMPRAERVLWARIRGKQVLGIKFRRQYGIGPYIVDFYCPELNIVIEADGDSHFESAAAIESDRYRQTQLENLGLKVLRFTNQEIFENIEGVLEKIIETVNRRPPLAPPS